MESRSNNNDQITNPRIQPEEVTPCRPINLLTSHYPLTAFGEIVTSSTLADNRANKSDTKPTIWVQKRS